MPKLNDADMLYVGAEPVLQVMLGRTEVWVPPGSGTPMIFGNNVTPDPGAGFPGSGDRSLFSLFNKSNAGPVTDIHVHFRSDATAGSSCKVAAYANSAGYPGALLWATAALAVPAGCGWLTPALPGDVSGTNPAGDYFLVVVTNSFEADPGKSDSVGTAYRKEGFNFNTPPNPFPTGPADASYTGAMAIYCGYLGS